MKWLTVNRLKEEEQTVCFMKQNFCNFRQLKSTNLVALKVESPFNYKEKFRLKSLNKGLTRARERVFFIYFL